MSWPAAHWILAAVGAAYLLAAWGSPRRGGAAAGLQRRLWRRVGLIMVGVALVVGWYDHFGG